jgi:hypothetical protein
MYTFCCLFVEELLRGVYFHPLICLEVLAGELATNFVGVCHSPPLPFSHLLSPLAVPTTLAHILSHLLSLAQISPTTSALLDFVATVRDFRSPAWD